MQNTVGIFDSGIGGLTVLSACRRLLPETLFYYLGDNARAPYGSLPPETVTSYAREAMTAFAHLGVSAAVLACNTVTAVCADLLRAEYAFPILGVEPAVLPAARLYHNVLVLCTPRTAESERLRSLMARCPHAHFTVCPLPRLAGEIEDSFRGKPLRLGDHLPRGTFGAVALGCTHYSFFGTEISAFYSAPVFDGAEGVARRLHALVGEEKCLDTGLNSHFCKVLNISGHFDEMTKNNIIFIGNDKIFNKNVYKQTFAFKKSNFFGGSR